MGDNLHCEGEGRSLCWLFCVKNSWSDDEDGEDSEDGGDDGEDGDDVKLQQSSVSSAPVTGWQKVHLGNAMMGVMMMMMLIMVTTMILLVVILIMMTM